MKRTSGKKTLIIRARATTALVQHLAMEKTTTTTTTLRRMTTKRTTTKRKMMRTPHQAASTRTMKTTFLGIQIINIFQGKNEQLHCVLRVDCTKGRNYFLDASSHLYK